MTVTTQNRAHKADVQWIKSAGRSFDVAGEHFVSEYVNVFTGQAIRKSWRMTGCDWAIFDESGSVVGQVYSLTFAKYEAATLAK